MQCSSTITAGIPAANTSYVVSALAPLPAAQTTPTAVVAIPVTVYGGDGDDLIIGGEGDNFLYGGAGDDWFYSPGAKVTGTGSSAVTTFGSAGDGNDLIVGGPGSDTIDYSARINPIFAKIQLPPGPITGADLSTADLRSCNSTISLAFDSGTAITLTPTNLIHGDNSHGTTTDFAAQLQAAVASQAAAPIPAVAGWDTTEKLLVLTYPMSTVSASGGGLLSGTSAPSLSISGKAACLTAIFGTTPPGTPTSTVSPVGITTTDLDLVRHQLR